MFIDDEGKICCRISEACEGGLFGTDAPPSQGQTPRWRQVRLPLKMAEAAAAVRGEEPPRRAGSLLKQVCEAVRRDDLPASSESRATRGRLTPAEVKAALNGGRS